MSAITATGFALSGEWRRKFPSEDDFARRIARNLAILAVCASYNGSQFAERGVEADHTTIWRWVQRYGPELERRLHRHLKPSNKSWRVDETYIRVKGSWCYLYRAIDSSGATIDLSGFAAITRAKSTP